MRCAVLVIGAGSERDQCKTRNDHACVVDVTEARIPAAAVLPDTVPDSPNREACCIYVVADVVFEVNKDDIDTIPCDRIVDVDVTRFRGVVLIEVIPKDEHVVDIVQLLAPRGGINPEICEACPATFKYVVREERSGGAVVKPLGRFPCGVDPKVTINHHHAIGTLKPRNVLGIPCALRRELGPSVEVRHNQGCLCSHRRLGGAEARGGCVARRIDDRHAHTGSAGCAG